MKHLLQRLHEIARLINRPDTLTMDEKALPEHLRNALEADILAKEIELADLTGFEAELADIEAAIASYAGGPENDTGDVADTADDADTGNEP